eukprot:572823-Pelagomonas_calceolata.AAC.1
MWKLAMKGIKTASGSWAKLRQLKAIAIERKMFLVLDTPTYHINLKHPAIYRTSPLSRGHEA